MKNYSATILYYRWRYPLYRAMRDTAESCRAMGRDVRRKITRLDVFGGISGLEVVGLIIIALMFIFIIGVQLGKIDQVDRDSKRYAETSRARMAELRAEYDRVFLPSVKNYEGKK